MNLRIDDQQQRELIDAVRRESTRIGMHPQTMLTIMAYETKGTLDPWIRGPETKWGIHRGLIQMGGPQRKQYGYDKTDTISEQVKSSADYLVDRGWKPGMSEVDAYSIVNAGGPGRGGWTDAHNGGAPGTVADKVASANWKAHSANMVDLLARHPEDTGLSDYVSKTEADATFANILAGTTPEAPGVFDTYLALDDMNVTAAPSPVAKRENPANRDFPDNAVGDLFDRDYGAPIPRTVQDMLSGAPEGSFLPGGPVEQALSVGNAPETQPASIPTPAPAPAPMPTPGPSVAPGLDFERPYDTMATNSGIDAGLGLSDVTIAPGARPASGLPSVPGVDFMDDPITPAVPQARPAAPAQASMVPGIPRAKPEAPQKQRVNVGNVVKGALMGGAVGGVPGLVVGGLAGHFGPKAMNGQLSMPSMPSFSGILSQGGFESTPGGQAVAAASQPGATDATYWQTLESAGGNSLNPDPVDMAREAQARRSRGERAI